MIELKKLNESQLDDFFFCGMPLTPNESGLNIDVWVTVKPFYDKESEPYMIIFEDIKNITSQSDYICLSISDNPVILLKNNLNIDNYSFEKTKDFIINNKKLLLDFWNMKIDSSDFFDYLK